MFKYGRRSPVLSGLSPVQFQALAAVPPELEWLANITNSKTRRAYQNDVAEFSRFAGLQTPAELRTVTRAHVIAWRKDLEACQLADSSIRRKLSALSSLFDYLCERNAVAAIPWTASGAPRAMRGRGLRRPSATARPGRSCRRQPRIR